MNWRVNWLRFSNPFRASFGERLSAAGVTEPVEVWRAVPSYAEDRLRPGDLVSTSPDVGHYAPRGKVIHARIRPEDLEYYQQARPGEVELRYVGTRPRGRVTLSNPIPSPQPADKYRLAGPLVDGRVVRADIPNTSSVSASLDDYEVLPGVREVPFSAFDQMGRLRYYSVGEERRTKDLARQIQQSGEIAPLIVVEDDQGPYVLEGGHRFDALRELGARSFPALVVLDLGGG